MKALRLTLACAAAAVVLAILISAGNITRTNQVTSTDNAPSMKTQTNPNQF